MKAKIEPQGVIEAYQNGESLSSIANAFGTYPTTIKRILEKNNIELRHDVSKKGNLMVKDGEKLIEWAKSQGRLVTRKELASIVGTKRLSPSYFVKYPELGKYVVTREQNELQDYTKKLYTWLQDNNIKYKPNDKTTIQSSVTALLLEDYSNIVLQISVKPKAMSKNRHATNMSTKSVRAKENKVEILFLDEAQLNCLDDLKLVLDDLKS